MQVYTPQFVMYERAVSTTSKTCIDTNILWSPTFIMTVIYGFQFDCYLRTSVFLEMF